MIIGNFEVTDLPLGKWISVFDKTLLHSLSLGFRHPRSREWLDVSAPLDDDFERVMKIFEYDEKLVPPGGGTGQNLITGKF